MENDYEQGHAIAREALPAYHRLSPSARRILHLCLEQTDEEGIARLSRNGLVQKLRLGSGSIQRAARELIDEGFVAQVGYARLAVNPQKVWTTRRDREDASLLAARWEQYKQGFAWTLARKQAAGRESWQKRLAAQGVNDGVVGEIWRGEEPPY
jgi:hypothetical protein